MKNIELNNVPNKPGIYIWKNKYDEIIYVGKAKRLRQRMSQYFKGMLNSYKTSSLVEEIEDFEYIITASEREALVLERNYIEKYFPKFNILLTDDKRYPYIKVTLKDELEISLAYRVRSNKNSDSKYFGPYPTGFRAKELSNLVSRITTYDKGLPIKGADKKLWRQKYNEAITILSSGSGSLKRELKQKMNDAAEHMQYELANSIKKSIESLEFTKEIQVVEFLNDENFDVIGVYEKDGYLSIEMLFYRNGLLLSSKKFVIEITSSLEESMRQFISQYYSINLKPSIIISNIDVEEFDVVVPKKGNKKRVLEISLENAKDNIDQKLNQYIRREEMTIGSLKKLSDLIGLKNVSHILMMDNSNTNNTLPVSVIVSYRNGIKQPKEYRKYSLERTGRDADVEYMRQGIEKYFGKKDNVIPDLFIVDGGIAQVNEARKILKDINVIGLVKNDKHSTEAIIGLNNERLEIDDSLLLNFLTGIQVEVDRYAKRVHSNQRGMRTLEGVLTSIEGVGRANEKKLLSHFGSYSAIYNAGLNELKEVVPVNVATNIYDFFKEK